MKLPYLSELNTSREMVDVFGGYNHNLRIGDGEFYNMQNLTADGYPTLSVRNRRAISDMKIEEFKYMLFKDGLYVTDEIDLLFNGTFVGGPQIDDIGDKDRVLLPFGSDIIIFPEKLKYNTLTKETTYLEKTYDLNTMFRFEMCNIESTAYNYAASATAPASPENGQYWLDTSSSPHSLKVYSTSTSAWTSVATAYVKISATDIGNYFNVYDGVEISGCTATGTAGLNGSAVVWAKGTDYIVVVGTILDAVSQEGGIKIERRVPDMDYVCVSENRVWGCKYGIVDGKTVNELYACKLGDPTNWNCFMGTSEDSYAVSLGSDGEFTGATTYLGYPLFFKENCIHKVYGNYPANYQVQTTNCRGVQKGSSKSIAMVDEVLYYKSAVDVCAYNGSLPATISGALGNEKYTDAVAGSFGSKYYISMKDTADEWHLFVYDTKRGMWHREDNTHVKGFCNIISGLLYVDDKDKLFSITGNIEELNKFTSADAKRETSINWFAETGNIGYNNPDNKYISKLNIRMSLAFGSTVDLYIQYDSCGTWEHKWSMNGVGTKSFMIPIIPRRCDHLRLKLVGKGDCKIFSLAKVLESGSDM